MVPNPLRQGDWSGLLEALFEHSVDGILLTRTDGTVLRANPAACRMLGRPEEEIRRCGREGLVVDDPALRELLLARRARGFAVGTFRFRRPDGSTFSVEATSAVLPFDPATPGGAGAPHTWIIFRDVSERERVAAALRHAEELKALHAAISELPVGVVVVEVGEAGPRVVDSNDAYARLIGGDVAPGTPVEALGVEAFEADRRTAIPESRFTGPRAARTGRSTRAAGVHLRRRDGAWRVIETSSAPMSWDGPGGARRAVTVAHDVTDEWAAAEALAASERELRALTARVQQAREEEKIRIARDLHDDLGQALTALSLELREAEELLEALGASAAAGPVLDHVVAAADLAAGTVAAIQRLSRDLRPVALEQLGLEPALRQEARAFEQRTGLAVEVRMEPSADLDAATATALFRIAQEALTNVARHAGARRVELWLDVTRERATLGVFDDGRGLPPGVPAAGHLGLLGMCERARALGGEVAFERRPCGGTGVRARIPRRQEPPR